MSSQTEEILRRSSYFWWYKKKQFPSWGYWINGDPSNVKGFKAELANFKAKNYLDKGIVNMSALTIEKLGKEDENNVYWV